VRPRVQTPVPSKKKFCGEIIKISQNREKKKEMKK
jgi:hypothetical protein